MMLLAQIRYLGGDVRIKPGGALGLSGSLPEPIIEQCKLERKQLLAALEQEAKTGLQYENSKYYVSLSVLYDSFMAMPYGSGVAKTIRDLDDVYWDRGVEAGRAATLAMRDHIMQQVDRAFGSPQDWGERISGEELVAEIRQAFTVPEDVTTFDPQTKRQPFVLPPVEEVKEQRDLFAAEPAPRRRFEP